MKFITKLLIAFFVLLVLDEAMGTHYIATWLASPDAKGGDRVTDFVIIGGLVLFLGFALKKGAKDAKAAFGKAHKPKVKKRRYYEEDEDDH